MLPPGGELLSPKLTLKKVPFKMKKKQQPHFKEKQALAQGLAQGKCN